MDNCLVCWEQNDNLVSSRIYLKLRVWKEYNVQQIIEKHLSWWHLRQTKQREPWICLQCWQELLSFHKFYERVENINHNLPQQKNLKNPSSIMNSSMRNSFDSDDDDDGDFKSPKRRKIIKRDIDDDNNIEEFTIVDVRTDNNIFIPETVMEDPFDDGHVNDKGTQANLITLDITEFKEDIKGLITTEIKSLRRGIQYDLNRLEEKLAPSMIALAPEDNSYAKKISEYKDLLDIHEPFNDLQTFCEFENKLRTDKECVDALRELITIKLRSLRNLTDAISAVISMVMTPELQVKFSACGKPNKGVAKENFSATKLYSELKDYLLIHFGNETEATVLSKTSRWLAAATGRLQR